MRVVKRVVALSALLLGGMSGWASAAEALPCAEWVSTGGGSEPGTGHLLGTTQVTYEYQVIIGGIGVKVTEEFEVGTYEFDGALVRIDCRSYTLFK